MGDPSSASSPAEAWSAAGRLLTPAAWAATALASVSALACGWFLVPLAIDALRPAPAPLKKIDDPQKNAEQQKVTFDGYLAQVKGRSLFYLPPPPQASTAATEPQDSDKPPPPPSSYGGPSIVAMLSDVVWFSNGRKLKVGEKHDDLEVVALSPPWTSRLKWKGVEFDVGFFERSRLTKSATEAAAGKSETPKDAATETPPAKTESPPEATPANAPPREPRPDQSRGGRDRRQDGGRQDGGRQEGGRRGRGNEPR